WVDHHMPQKISKAKYFNPRVENIEEYTPVSTICYYVAKQDLWIAAAGAVADYSIPPFFEEFRKNYPELASKSKNIDKIIYDTKLGNLIRLLNFSLKGSSSDVRKFVNIIKKVKEPDEILDPKEGPLKWVHKRYLEMEKEYLSMLSKALKQKYGKIAIFIYEEKKHSFTETLASELTYRIPNKKIYIIGREKSGYMRISLRSRKINLVPLLKKALEQVEGFGGGHPQACGASIKIKDFPRFLELMEEYSEKGL
ncbi:DHH family phosphoesterase, partial [Candidatus Woesearchaeota archaeon]|nr:DHH family phosphoesterase [Candidatus Woesearchaeota archaeon]